MSRPILYSFRRCPYAMRARMAISVSGQACDLREVVLRDKPTEMIAASAKATVPILELPNGDVLDESLAIMAWALAQNDPDNWKTNDPTLQAAMDDLIADFDLDFKHHLDRYKYGTRYDGAEPNHHRDEAMKILQDLDERLDGQTYLFGAQITLADIALMPFVRQFANTDRAWFDAQDLAKLQAWLSGLLASDLFTGVMQKYPAWKAGDVEPVFPNPD
jgi:glutathione S-transferase